MNKEWVYLELQELEENVARLTQNLEAMRQAVNTSSPIDEWESLTDAEIIAICEQREDLIDCIRAIERALMEKNHC